MTIDLDLPTWATVLLGIVLVAVWVSLSTLLWKFLGWLLFGRWYRALISVALIALAVYLGGAARLWAIVRDGWAESVWVTGGVLMLVGAPIAAVLGIVGRAASDPSPPPGPRSAAEQSAHNWHEQQWANEIDRRNRS